MEAVTGRSSPSFRLNRIQLERVFRLGDQKCRLASQAASGKAAGATAGSLALNGTLTLDTLRFAGLDATAALRMPELAAFRPMLAQTLPALRDVQFKARLTVPANVGSRAFKIVGGG